MIIEISRHPINMSLSQTYIDLIKIPYCQQEQCNTSHDLCQYTYN